MTIVTKYGISDAIFLLRNNQIESDTIFSIKIHIFYMQKNPTEICVEEKYILQSETSVMSYEPRLHSKNNLFFSRQDLINSL